MSGNRILGKNVIAELKISGVYYPFFCCKTAEFSQNQETIEVTSVNSATGREYEPGMMTATLNVAGVSVIDNSLNHVAITYLMAESIRRTVQDLRIRLIDDLGATQQISFQALITNNTLSRSFGSYSQSATAFVVTGGITIGAVDPPAPIEVEVYSDYWTPGAGVNFVDLSATSSGTSPSAVANGGPFTIGATDLLLEANMEGDEFDIILSGSVGNRQCKLNTSTFILTFQAGMIFDGTQRVFIEFKRTL